MTTKDEILSEIRRCAEANGGHPLGRNRFAQETGIPESAWAGRYWVSWSEAVTEAGYAPNVLTGKRDVADILGHVARLARRLGRFPVENEFRMARREDPTFPSHGTVRRIGTKAILAARLIEYCEEQGGFDDVVELAQPFAEARAEEDSSSTAAENGQTDGYVYLMKSGKHYKIGHTNAVGRREYELGIQLPEKLEQVHVIRTDDPRGIERYWHDRFAGKRGNGEWFKLTPQDVRSFKRRRDFM